MRELRWNASHMPEACAAVAAGHRDMLVSAPLIGDGWHPSTQEQFRRVASTTEAAPMYWSSAELTPFLRHIAGRSLPASLRDLLPSPSGTLLWGSSPMTVQSDFSNLGGGLEDNHLDGVVWTDADPVVWLTFLSRFSVESAAQTVARLEAEGRTALASKIRRRIPESFAYIHTPLDGDASTYAATVRDRPWFREALELFAATLVLAASDQIVDARDTVPPKKRRPPHARAGVAHRPVRVVRLRPAPPTGRRHGESEREYQHRWIVSGHMRWQPYGPGMTQRRLQWIAPYVKGPADRPLADPRPVVHHISP